jgi:hypothetical protein
MKSHEVSERKREAEKQIDNIVKQLEKDTGFKVVRLRWHWLHGITLVMEA